MRAEAAPPPPVPPMGAEVEVVLALGLMEIAPSRIPELAPQLSPVEAMEGLRTHLLGPDQGKLQQSLPGEGVVEPVVPIPPPIPVETEPLDR